MSKQLIQAFLFFMAFGVTILTFIDYHLFYFSDWQRLEYDYSYPAR